MNTRRIFLLAACCLAALLLQARTVDEGVDREFAAARAAQVSNVRYSLTFDIPESRQQAVTGTVSILFEIAQREDVTLDFQGQLTGACRVNGKLRALTQEREHIVIPRKFLRKGGNVVELGFASLDLALNRHDDYLYTLFVPDHARSAFPCFDQPDMKAYFTAQASVPSGWKFVSSCGTKPIPTYLFSLVAGRFQERTAQVGGRLMRALYRETDPQKVAQLDRVFSEAAQSIGWMERYTGIAYPFDSYGLVILPGYQFGGMEHPGAIQLKDTEVFLGQNPTQEEELARVKLIAHETAHMWFGDLVTMRWFDDVWTKEVFANFLANKIAQEQFPGIDHNLNFIQTHYARAMATDRSRGTHAISQQLDNLDQASLLYGSIIYNKAPVMMRKLEEQMGEQSLRSGLQQYLRQYANANASWDELVDVLSAQSPSAKVKEFSQTWVHEKGMPTILTEYRDGKLVITQIDSLGRGLVWNQKFDILIGYDLAQSMVYPINMQEPAIAFPLAQKPDFIIPNYTGRGYGRFILDKEYTQAMIRRLMCERNDLSRYNLALMMRDNYLMHRIDASYFGELYRTMETERNPLVTSTVLSHMFGVAFDRDLKSRKTLELCMMDLTKVNRSTALRQHLLKLLGQHAVSPEVLDTIYRVWDAHNEPLLSERDYTNIAYRLAIMYPARWQEILAKQRSRLNDADALREFDFVSRACTPDADAQRALFRSLLSQPNRTVEPWALKTLALLCSDVRERQCVEYITPALDVLEELQRTGGIFFPSNWLAALLGSCKSREACQKVTQFLDAHPDYPQNLRNKILEAAWPLMNRQ